MTNLSFFGILEDYYHSTIVVQWLVVMFFFVGTVLGLAILYLKYFPTNVEENLAAIASEKNIITPPLPLHLYMHIGWIAPSFSIASGVLISYFFHFEATTSFKEDCFVSNPLPSISYAIGSNVPERWIFSIGIVMMSWERVLNLIMHYYWFQKYLPQDKGSQRLHFLNSILCMLNWAENLSLLGVSLLSAVEHPFLHEKSFHAWAIFQQFKMMLCIYLHGKIPRHPKKATAQKCSFRRLWFWRANLVALILGLVIIQIDIHYCIPFLYSAAAIIEYIIVMTNIAFNYCVIFDFPDKIWFVVKKEEDQGWNED